MSNTFDKAMPMGQCGPELAGNGLASRVVAAIVAWRDRQRALAELSALDSRILRDIGLDRTEFVSVLTDKTGERRIRLSDVS